MSDLQRAAERIAALYFEGRLTSIALDPEGECLLVQIKPALLESPDALVALLKGVLAEAGPFALHFEFSPPATVAGRPLLAG